MWCKNARVSIATFLDAIKLVPDSEDAFWADSIPTPTGMVFGGQVLAQALIAAGQTVDPDRHAHSLHAYFLRGGDLTQRIRFEVERLRDGRSFSTRNVNALQAGRVTLTLAASFQLDQEGLQHGEPMPVVAPPDSVTSMSDQPVNEETRRARDFLNAIGVFDLRNVTRSAESSPLGDEEHLVWMRLNADLTGAPPLLHAALLAASSDFYTSGPVLHRHGARPLSAGVRIASLDHAMWFHRQARIDQWLLVRSTSTAAAGGRGLTLASVFNEDGQHVASFAQEVMVRLT
jgi:acyl-CoA thioesterase-2